MGRQIIVLFFFLLSCYLGNGCDKTFYLQQSNKLCDSETCSSLSVSLFQIRPYSVLCFRHPDGNTTKIELIHAEEIVTYKPYYKTCDYFIRTRIHRRCYFAGTCSSSQCVSWNKDDGGEFKQTNSTALAGRMGCAFTGSVCSEYCGYNERTRCVWTDWEILLGELNPNGQEITEIVDLYSSWGSDRGYNILIAATDMFFHRFPGHQYANIRIGTTGSRYRDCAALLSYGYITNLLGLPNVTDFMEWIFIPKIGDELEAMMGPEEELQASHSYFPYQVDFGLVNKSAYSAASNPHFFHLVHTTGALLRSQRSMLARNICEGQIMK